MNNYPILSHTPLFSGISLSEIETIFSQIHFTQKSFDKEDMLAFQGEVCNRLIILIEGRVRAEMTDPSGKMVKIEDLEAPSPLAILFLFGANNHFPVTATADVASVALIIPKESVLKMLQLNTKLLQNYLNISADFAQRLSQKLYFMSFRTIRQKISMMLLDLANKQSSFTVQLQTTKSSLAAYFGVSRPSLERELTHMQNEGLITINKKEITLLEPQKMKFLVQFG